MTSVNTKHDRKPKKTYDKWRTFRYNKTEHICTNLYSNHSLL